MKSSWLSIVACALPALAHPPAGGDEEHYVETVYVDFTTTICPKPTTPPPPCEHGGDGGDGGYGPGPSGSSTVSPGPDPTGSASSTNLALKRDWELDASDFSQLELKKSCRMMYAKDEVVLGDRPPETDPLAWVTMNETAYPNLQTVNSQYFSKVWCDLSAGWIKMQFSTWDSYDYAWSNWHDKAREEWGDYVIITPEESCKNYGADQMRYFVKATSEERDDDSQTITCQIEDVSFEETVGDDNEVAVDFENFAGGNNEDGSLTANADKPFPGGFDDKGAEVLRDPSGDTDFDRYKDSQIGHMDLATLNTGLLDEFNMTLEDFYGPSDVPDLAEDALLAKRRIGDRIRRAAKKIAKKVKQAVQKVKEVVKKVAETIVEVAKDIADAIADFTTVDKSLNKNLNFDSTTLGDIVETPFSGKEGYLLFHGEFEDGEDVTAAGTLDIFCVECGIEGRFNIRGQVKFVISRLSFEEGFVEITGNMGAGLGLGIAADLTVSKEFEKQIASIPLTPFSIPNIFVLGPKADVAAGVGFELQAVGQLLAGARADWPAIQARLDVVESARSGVSGFTPQITPIFEVEGQITLTTEFFLKFSLGVGIDILNGLFDKSVELIDKPGMFITAGVGAAFDLENGVTGVGENGCAGLDIALGFNNEVSINVFDIFDEVLDSRSIEAFQRCIPFPLNKRHDIPAVPLLEGRQQTVNSIGNTTFEDGILTNMFVRDEERSLQLRYSPNGNTYAVPDSKVPDQDDEWSGWFATDESGVFVIGDSHGRLFHGYRNTLAEHGVSRLRLHAPNDMPQTAEMIIFAATIVDDEEDDEVVVVAKRQEEETLPIDLPYMMASDLSGEELYFPVVCVYESGKVYPKMFLVKDTEAGLATLMSNDPAILKEVTGGNLKECEYVPITNNRPGVDIEAVAEDEPEV